MRLENTLDAEEISLIKKQVRLIVRENKKRYFWFWKYLWWLLPVLLIILLVMLYYLFFTGRASTLYVLTNTLIALLTIIFYLLAYFFQKSFPSYLELLKEKDTTFEIDYNKKYKRKIRVVVISNQFIFMLNRHKQDRFFILKRECDEALYETIYLELKSMRGEDFYHFYEGYFE